MGLAGVALLMVGYIHFLELPATTLRVSSVESTAKDIRTEQLESKLDEAYKALCMNPGAPEVLERIRELQEKYVAVTGNRYPAPSCNLLTKIK